MVRALPATPRARRLLLLALLGLAGLAPAQVSGVGPPKPKAEGQLSARDKLKRSAPPPVIEGGNGPVTSRGQKQEEVIPKP
jgi:hypothetical protein